ncbi:uncharacterized protein DUF1876 [Saccharopolyspora erythraea NRRL 2338]|uniref:Uncharacterized protein n=2 Tax=Saccharopolyspora erythraea TaxID=1836 RepID=A4FCE9_SACEN|nr:dsRBD fold-containing protein [Saccharopolyspora erythraea]PFG95487.1 uncharacterized protein DUF1876 [Saccharopolyspora erythraea NRRL 2338]QRK92116.1 DUF1876 domain-containing protein [Saccharopolyspora erythraea]CAM01724.1 hypothetical protein SACE_2426 [Saccharopolyspora erythraea NRRL 2338]
MVSTEHWSVDIYLDEDEERTHAEARLHTRDATDLRGRGLAKRNPHDRDVPEIGAELAAARALFELAHHLLRAATEDVEQATGRPAHLHS